MESINTGCVQSAGTRPTYMGTPMKGILMNHVREGFLEEVTHKQTQDKVTRQNNEGCSGQ